MTNSPTSASSNTSHSPGLLLARGSARAVEQATGLLERLLAAADDGHRLGSSIEILVLLALARQASGDRAVRHGFSSRSAGSGRAGGLRAVDPRCRAGRWQVCSARSPRATQHAARILGTGRSTHARHTRVGDPDELSERELDVLRLLRSDLTGPDIARELHVSLNTLRTHTKHIYTKLGATNRREAVTRAAELGL